MGFPLRDPHLPEEQEDGPETINAKGGLSVAIAEDEFASLKDRFEGRERWSYGDSLKSSEAAEPVGGES